MGLAAGHTDTLSVSNSLLGTPVTAATFCCRITVGEDGTVSGAPTTNYNVYKPDYNSTPRQVFIGQTYTFQGIFVPGQIVGYIKSITGTTTFFKDESPAS